MQQPNSAVTTLTDVQSARYKATVTHSEYVLFIASPSPVIHWPCSGLAQAVCCSAVLC